MLPKALTTATTSVATTLRTSRDTSIQDTDLQLVIIG